MDHSNQLPLAGQLRRNFGTQKLDFRAVKCAVSKSKSTNKQDVKFLSKLHWFVHEKFAPLENSKGGQRTTLSVIWSRETVS
jgi:hypothetical protein